MSKIKYIILLSIGFIFLNFIIYLFTEENKNQRIELSSKSYIDKLQTHYEILMHQQRLTADGTYKSTIITPNVIEILTKAYKTKDKKQRDDLRKELYDLLKQRYKMMFKKGVLQYHFVFPNNEVFLRFHKLSKYGDNLTGIRTDFEYTNKTKKIFRGFAQGRTAHAFRNVYPLFSKPSTSASDKNNNHIGAMEVSFSSDVLQKNFTLISKMHTHFLVDKTIFDAKAWERDDLVLKYNQSAEHQNYMITMTKEHTKEECIEQKKINLKSILKDIDKKIKKGKKFTIYTQDKDGEVLHLAFLPIYGSVDNQILAWIVSYEQNEFISTTIKETFYIRIILFIILLILFYFIYRTVNQKEILKEIVDEKTAELKDINENLEEKVILEVKKSKEIEKRLFQSEKMAAMGEMIGNIAHQWRQPLNALNVNIENLEFDYEDGIVNKEFLDKFIIEQTKTLHYMSKTIDDFRNFYRIDKEKVDFSIKKAIENSINIQTTELKKYGIIINIIGEDFTIYGFVNEFQQVIMNLISNTKDAIVETKQKNGQIDISLMDEKIIFKDNGGGIPDDIIKRIFEPYYTTKEQGKGTGMGLYMSKMIIEDNMGGKISVSNVDDGAEFIIVLVPAQIT
ncbi:MAG: hypothetical protein KAQ94_10295 [Arcobacteraceae bacterium]|nr:hypothetical protein [Arcobacteraceae bacterium]